MINVEEEAKNSLQKFYSKKKYPNQPEIDFKNIRVQIEEFGWKTAKYRIDLFFLHQQPSFLPYHQNFWTAHKLFMTETGEVIKHDQGYTSRAVHPDPKLNEKRKIHKDLSGFFPGNYYFKKYFDFSDEILKEEKGSIKGVNTSWFNNEPHEFQLKFKRGISDLETCEASIVEFKDYFEITIEEEKYVENGNLDANDLFGLSMNNFSFNIGKNKEISEVTIYLRPYYGLE